MKDKVPMKVTEIQLNYKNKIKAIDRPKIRSSSDAYSVFKSNWSNQMALLEEFNILLLDRSNRVLAMCPISKGGISGTVVDLKIVFATALKGRASALILAHNHPSGAPRSVHCIMFFKIKELLQRVLQHAYGDMQYKLHLLLCEARRTMWNMSKSCKDIVLLGRVLIW